MPNSIHIQLILDDKTYEGLADMAESFGYSLSRAVLECVKSQLEESGWMEWKDGYPSA